MGQASIAMPLAIFMIRFIDHWLYARAYISDYDAATDCFRATGAPDKLSPRLVDISRRS